MSQPYGFAIHTSSPDLGLAISNFNGDARSQVWNLGRDLSTHLHVHLAEFLAPQQWNHLAFLAVARGPGGFTGTRIGVVTARTLAQQLRIPLFAISSLQAIAWSSLRNQAESPQLTDIAVQMQAQRGELFGAIYRPLPDYSGLQTLLADTVMSPTQWEDQLQQWQAPYSLLVAVGDLGSTVTSVLELAYQQWQQGAHPSWAEALPFYGQHPVEI